jgi:rRNA maturation endonuclease Nob1
VGDSLEERPGCLASLLRLLGVRRENGTSPEPLPYPPPAGDGAAPDASSVPAHAYRLRDDFLSPAEANLLRVLREVAGDWALICPKVRLADLVYTPRQEDRQAALNRISRKHLDFVLCDAGTLRPALAIELDDRSHERTDRRERDVFVDQVLADVGLPLVRVPVQRSYDTRALAAMLTEARAGDEVTTPAETPASEPGEVCPRCGGRLERRVARQGPRAGEPFLGCSNYPRCRYTAPIPA